MKAIETEYKGYRFRSRLEARWAVFFDRLGVPWEYEPEGFELGAGARYLPDFKIGNFYAEVKPRAGDLGQFDTARLFARRGGRVICLGGTPDTIAYPVMERGLNGEVEVSDVAINGDSKYGPFYWCCGVELWQDWRTLDYFDDALRLADAIRAARGARFEFGESGGPGG